MTSGAERRIHPRRDALPVDVADIDPGAGEVFEAVLRADVIDQSFGGAGIAMRQPLVPEKGARFQVRLSRDVPRMAEVAWRVEDEDGTIRLGLRFLE